MADYIRRDIVLEIINTVNDTGGFAGYADYCVLFDEIDTMPAADIQPVKCCRMIPFEPDCRGYTDVFICTNCQLHIHLGFIGQRYGGNYCIECGAEVEDSE